MNYLIPVIIAFIFTCLLSGCGGKSDVSGEIVEIERVCRVEKTKPVAVEGYLSPKTARCERASRKKNAGIIGCSFDVYADSDQTGAKIPVYILTSGWLSGKNNRLEGAEDYAGDFVFRDKNGNPLPKKELKFYDNDGNLIPSGSKVRIYGTLPNAERCEISLAERIEKVS